ncbi:C2 domain-containing protein [Phanerochaete sordida]|uniref:C2 domain-containing protein n=1 Tax=Phanerochaete sordida TaxID=48140 RepID=A0A9P3GDL9_9APHY|nr:C2 domain-containing protein [Phanerochaete sordida]
MTSDETLYTCKITFIKVDSVPVADFNDMSCDPYLQVTLTADTDAQNSEGIPQILTYRTHTCRRTLDPVFNAHWVVSGIPASGFMLSVKLRDEDPGNYDDDLGKSVLHMPNPDEGALAEGWKSGDREYKVQKRKGAIMPRLFTCTANVVTGGNIGHRVRLWVRCEVMGKAENQKDKRMYTVGPRKYVRHFSPLIGKFLGQSNSPDGGDRNTLVKPTAFVANRLQLAGPVPGVLRHRYVGFAPFVKAMFRRSGIRGLLLHHTLHKQHLSLYKWDKNVVWGVIGDGDEDPQGEEKDREGAGEGAVDAREAQKDGALDSDSVAMARQFLRMTSYGTQGRIFTYVIMLDGEWRFTETGDQMAIEFLSKHTMHSDVAVEIAYSGEFFVRPLRRRRNATKDPAPGEPEPPQNTHTDDAPASGDPHRNSAQPNDQRDAPAPENAPEDEHSPDAAPFDDAHPPDDPAQYELVIDNDSGTYRPRADLLPVLHAYLASPRNLGALGRVTALNAFDARLKRWKDARKKAKAGERLVRADTVSSAGSAGSSGSSGSRGSSVSGVSGAEGVKTGDMRAVVEEDAKRARENDDQDTQAKREEGQADDENEEPSSH